MKDAASLRAQAAKCRELATACDDATAENLRMIADESELQAERLEARLDQPD